MDVDVGRLSVVDLVRIKPGREIRMRMDVSSKAVYPIEWSVHEARCDLSVGNTITAVTTIITATEDGC